MRACLKIVPVKRYPEPAYPTKSAVILDPSVLRSLPRRWSAKPAVCAALLLTLTTGLYSCSKDEGNENQISISIPFFNHRNERSILMGDAPSPQVYLTEKEASQVIREEAEKVGINFNGRKTIEVSFPEIEIADDGNTIETTRAGKLRLDGYDKSLGIGFEFISENDVVKWNKNENAFYDEYGMAEYFSESTKNVVFFCEPDISWDETDFDATEQKEFKLEYLRAQVRDFLEWLAAQGVI